MTDIVERLRKETNIDTGDLDPASRWGWMMVEAADEIERLRAAMQWRPIEEAPSKGMRPHMILGHAEKKWIRFGWYYAACRKWYYSGTSERTQYAQVEGDAPTHFMPLPPPPEGEKE